jgi:aspartate 1-decarboxylase
MRKLVGGKLHCIRVTDANLDYHGSIILDPDHCEQAGILSHGVRGSLGCVD